MVSIAHLMQNTEFTYKNKTLFYGPNCSQTKGFLKQSSTVILLKISAVIVLKNIKYFEEPKQAERDCVVLARSGHAGVLTH